MHNREAGKPVKQATGKMDSQEAHLRKVECQTGMVGGMRMNYINTMDDLSARKMRC